MDKYGCFRHIIVFRPKKKGELRQKAEESPASNKGGEELKIQFRLKETLLF